MNVELGFNRQSEGISSFVGQVQSIIKHNNAVSDLAICINQRDSRYALMVKKYERNEELTEQELEEVRDVNAICNRDIDSSPTKSLSWVTAYVVLIHRLGYGWKLDVDISGNLCTRYGFGNPPDMDDIAQVRHFSHITKIEGKKLENRVFHSMALLIHFL